MVNKRIVGGLAAAALTASSLGVAAGPALATGAPPKPHFAKIKAEVDNNGDLDIAFKEVHLRSGQRVRVIGEADVVKATYAVSTTSGVVLRTARATGVEDKFKARALSFSETQGWFVKGHVELKHPALLDNAVPPAPVPHATLIKVVYKGVDLTDVKTGAHFVFPTRIAERLQ